MGSECCGASSSLLRSRFFRGLEEGPVRVAARVCCFSVNLSSEISVLFNPHCAVSEGTTVFLYVFSELSIVACMVEVCLEGKHPQEKLGPQPCECLSVTSRLSFQALAPGKLELKPSREELKCLSERKQAQLLTEITLWITMTWRHENPHRRHVT